MKLKSCNHSYTGVASETAAVTDINAENARNSEDAHIQELLSQSESWNMDIFALERLTDHRCLSNLGTYKSHYLINVTESISNLMNTFLTVNVTRVSYCIWMEDSFKGSSINDVRI